MRNEPLTTHQQIIDELRALEADRLSIDTQLETSPERMKSILTHAREVVDVRLSEILQDSVTVDFVNQQKEQYQNDALQLQTLVDQGIFTEDEAESELRTLALHEDYELLRVYTTSSNLIGSTALTETIDVENIEESDIKTTELSSDLIVDSSLKTNDIPTELTTSEIQTEEIDESKEVKVEKQPAQLTIFTKQDGTKELKVGLNRGKRIKLSSKTRNDQNDYTKHREIALQLIVDAKGEIVRSTTISKAIVESGLEKSPLTTRAIYGWLSNIKFYGSNLILPTGNRGIGGGFFVSPNFDATLDNRVAKQIKERTTTTEMSVKAGKKPTKVQDEEKFIEAIEHGSIPLRESAVFVTYLSVNSDLLSALKIPVPNSQMVEAIDEASLIEDERTGTKRKSNLISEELDEERRNVGRQFRAIFNNEELFDAFLNNIAEGDVLEPLADYLGTYDEVSWDTLLNQVLKAKVSTTISEISNGKLGSSVATRINYISLPNGRMFCREVSLTDGTSKFYEKEITRRIWQEGDTIEIQENDDVTQSTSTIKLRERPSIPELPAIKSTKSESAQIVSDSEPVEILNATIETKTTPEWVSEFKKQIGESLDRLELDNAIFEGTMIIKNLRALTQSSNIIGTDTAVNRLVKAKIIDLKGVRPIDAEVTLAQTVLMSIYNRNKSLFTSKTRREQALKIVEDSVASYMQAFKKRQVANR